MVYRDYRKIFKYPAVQYIPLKLYDLKYNEYNYPFSKSRFYIYNQDNQEDLKQTLKNLNQPSNYSPGPDQLVLLVFNGKIDFIRYRSHEVIMVGKITPGFYQLFKIKTGYFYKDRLIFNFYDGETQKVVYRKNLFLRY